ncbi:MAG TPA: heme o synthase [Vicinamibacterales bacterium]|nr:heme o synthase [Vicinamibacterales bacterium]
MKNAPAELVQAAAVQSATPKPALADYVELMKPRLNVLVVASSAAGYYMGLNGATDVGAMAAAVAGTALVAAGAAALNQVSERDTDAMMQRTAGRPLPGGRVSSFDAAVFGTLLSIAGLALLAFRANRLSAALAAATILIYLVVYTPMKRRTPLSTLVGAVPGALPPLIGWTAAHGSIAQGGAALFAILFLWQVPHFMAIAWLFRDDYARAQFPMLAVIDPTGRRAARQAVFFAGVLLPISLLPSFIGVAGAAYLAFAVTLGLGFVWLAIRFAADRDYASARMLFLGSITYLPLLWIAMIANKL